MKKIILFLFCIGILSCSTEENDNQFDTTLNQEVQTENNSETSPDVNIKIPSTANSIRMSQTSNCYFVAGSTFTSNNFGNSVILIWDFTNVVFDEDLTFVDSEIEIRVFDADFCTVGGEIPLTPTSTTFHPIPDIINNPTGSINLPDSDFSQKCFIWRINSTGGLTSDTSPFQTVTPCASNTDWFLHDLD